MTRDAFVEMLWCNEPCFEYQGKEYSICHPSDKYYVTAEDNPDDLKLEFSSAEELLDKWMIQGKPLGKIISEIDL